jgi:hypothetical protein
MVRVDSCTPFFPPPSPPQCNFCFAIFFAGKKTLLLVCQEVVSCEIYIYRLCFFFQKRESPPVFAEEKKMGSTASVPVLTLSPSSTAPVTPLCFATHTESIAKHHIPTSFRGGDENCKAFEKENADDATRLQPSVSSEFLLRQRRRSSPCAVSFNSDAYVLLGPGPPAHQHTTAASESSLASSTSSATSNPPVLFPDESPRMGKTKIVPLLREGVPHSMQRSYRWECSWDD